MSVKSEINRLIRYDPVSGHLYNRVDRACGSFAGKRLGTVDSLGYLALGINSKVYRAHRVIWVLVHGYWPDQIDHINGNRADNRLVNLREANNKINRMNMALHKDNKSGVSGVHWDRDRSKWMVRIKKASLGRYDDWWEAVCVRKAAEYKYGFHPNHGRQ